MTTLTPTAVNVSTPRWTKACHEPARSAWFKAAHVIVDWSNETSARTHHSHIAGEGEDQLDDAELTMEQLMAWVKSYQERASVHVVLKRSFLERKNRQLQRALQSIGCRVTMRSHQPHPEQELVLA